MDGGNDVDHNDQSKPEANTAAIDQFKEVVARANTGNPAALAALKELLDRNPHVWQHCRDLALLAEGGRLTIELATTVIEPGLFGLQIPL